MEENEVLEAEVTEAPETEESTNFELNEEEDVPVGEVGLFRQNGKGFIKQKGEKYLISSIRTIRISIRRTVRSPAWDVLSALLNCRSDINKKIRPGACNTGTD